MFEQVFLKASVVLRGESVCEAEEPSCAVSQPLNYKWENYWKVDRCLWVREQERGMEDGVGSL